MQLDRIQGVPDDEDDDSDDWETDEEGEVSEDSHAGGSCCGADKMCSWHALEFRQNTRQLEIPDIPNVIKLTGNDGSKAYVIGTAHVSEVSADDVAMLIQKVMPDVVMLELCSSRTHLLTMDEETLKNQMKNPMETLRGLIRKSGVLGGVATFTLIKMVSDLVEKMGTYQGVEMRRAFIEAKKIPGCVVALGDRHIQTTLLRAIRNLSLWQQLKIFYQLLTHPDLSAEDVEKMKVEGELNMLLNEFAKQFPSLAEILIHERDQYMAHTLNQLTVGVVIKEERPDLSQRSVVMPSVVVAVVGLGHLQGIQKNWGQSVDLHALNSIPPPPLSQRIAIGLCKIAVYSVLAYGVYRTGRIIHRKWS